MVSAIINPDETAFNVRASQQWYTRPNDQRYLTLEALHEYVSARRDKSHEETVSTSKLELGAEWESDTDDKGYVVLKTGRGDAKLTNYSFGQLCRVAGVDTAERRRQPADLAYVNLRWGLESQDPNFVKGLIVQDGTDTEIRALTSDTYGRIYDADVSQKVMELNDLNHGIWTVPEATYSKTDPLRATTLYASDRDIFIFLVDKSKPVEVDGDILFRGFMTWNSEVGSKTFGLTTFYYRYVCDNRMIWGGKDVKEMRIRHTQYGPTRFQFEAAPELERYVNSSPSGLINTIKEAKVTRLGDTIKKVSDRLFGMGISRATADKALDRAQIEEPQLDPKSIWGVVQGLTSVARDIRFTDDRVALETKAGELMEMVEA